LLFQFPFPKKKPILKAFLSISQHSMTQPQITPPPSSDPTTLIPHEGWVVLHLFYSINTSLWELLNDIEKETRRQEFETLLSEIRATEKTQLLSFSIVSPKADLAFMLLTPSLQLANQFEKQLNLALGADILSPCYSYLSMTEWTEYSQPEAEFKQQLIDKEQLSENSEAFNARLAEWKKHMDKYYQDRLYPNMPDWPIFCFYPMSKRRNVDQNWYSTPYEERRTLMAGHARTGRKYSGKIRQLITGSTGLDTHEWGVTLFAHDLFQVKSIVYEMRFDEVSARYAEFGDFYIGIQLPSQELFKRLLLN
jgi:chlorite dismutase